MPFYTDQEVDQMNKDFVALRKSLKRMIDMHEMLMKEINHRSCCYSANTIREINEAPGEAKALLA